MPFQRLRTSKRQSADLTPRRQFAQIAVPFMLPAFCIGALGSLLKLDHPLLALALSPLAVAGTLAFGYCLRVAAKAAAAWSTRAVPRWLYGLAGLCFLCLTVVGARLSYAESHASGNEAFSITLGFLASYSAIVGRAAPRADEGVCGRSCDAGGGPHAATDLGPENPSHGRGETGEYES